MENLATWVERESNGAIVLSPRQKEILRGSPNLDENRDRRGHWPSLYALHEAAESLIKSAKKGTYARAETRDEHPPIVDEQHGRTQREVTGDSIPMSDRTLASGILRTLHLDHLLEEMSIFASEGKTNLDKKALLRSGPRAFQGDFKLWAAESAEQFAQWSQEIETCLSEQATHLSSEAQEDMRQASAIAMLAAEKARTMEKDSRKR